MIVSLTTHMQPIAVLHTDGPEITIGKHFTVLTLQRLCSTSGIVLWDYEGLWGLLDQFRLKASLSQFRDAQLLAMVSARTKPRAVIIHHSGTTPLPAGLAKIWLATADSPTW